MTASKREQWPTLSNHAKSAVLAISNHSSAVRACQRLELQAIRIRPIEITRSLEFDRVLEDIQQQHYALVWIDLQMLKIFCGLPRYAEVMARIQTVVMTARRNSVDVFLASHRQDAWETLKVQHLVQSCGLVESCHRWCILGISASASAAKSAAVHRIASLPGVKDTPCTCPENTTHINELALDRETTSHRRGLAEEQFVEHILTTALSWAPAEPGVESKNPADSVPEAELEFPVHVSETIPSLQDTVCCITCPECNLLMPQAGYHCLSRGIKRRSCFPYRRRTCSSRKKEERTHPR